jgi:hypothetical protein
MRADHNLPSTRSDRRWALRLGLGFAALALLLHVPGLLRPLFNSDEASLATMAMVIERGGTLYHETADRKPPVVPYVYALVFKATGSRDLRPVRAVAALVVAATALLLALEAKRRAGTREAGLVAGLFLLAGTTANFPADSQAAGFELFMLLPMSAAVVAAARGKAVLAGLCLALACLCKQTAVVTLAPVALLLYRTAGWRAVARAVLAAVGLVLTTALAFGPKDFLLWTVTGNGGYLSFRGSLWAPLLRGLGMTAAFVGFNLVLVGCCLVAWRRRREDLDLWLWLAGGALAVLAGFRFFGHYYLQLVPPLALLAASHLADHCVRATQAGWRRWRKPACALVLLPVAAMWLFSFFPPNARGILPYRDVADRVRSLTAPSDRVFIWGVYPEIYWAAGREPATRFIHTGFLTGNSGGRDARVLTPSDGIPGAWDFLAADLAATPPDLIVDTSTTSIRESRYHPLEATFLWPEVVNNYRQVDMVDGVRFFRRYRSSG